jgi:acyl-CoA reductase-like NAD-dependent aldehyde dehydrogenase
VDASSSKIIPVISPINGELLSEMTCSTSADLDVAVAAAKTAFSCVEQNACKRTCASVF